MHSQIGVVWNVGGQVDTDVRVVYRRDVRRHSVGICGHVKKLNIHIVCETCAVKSGAFARNAVAAWNPGGSHNRRKRC